MRRPLVCLLLLLACTRTWPAQSDGVAVALYAEPFAPLQYPGAGGEPNGYVYKFAQEALARTAQRLPLRQAQPLRFVPLKRALALALTEPNVLLLSVARTPQREADYLWLGEVSPYQVWLYHARGRALPPLRSPAELRGQKLRFGVQDGGNFQEWLAAQGIGEPGDNSSVDPVAQNMMNLRKALAGRIDLFAFPEVSLTFRARELGLSADDFEPVLPLPALSHPLWLAISKKSDPRLVEELTHAVQALKAAGRLAALLSQHSK
jgi:polar amino acid transport system substrate-binding protein